MSRIETACEIITSRPMSIRSLQPIVQYSPAVHAENPAKPLDDRSSADLVAAHRVDPQTGAGFAFGW
ncbi:MAG: hypothetical protein R3D59_01435 [Paracoccaceae bacterium]